MTWAETDNLFKARKLYFGLVFWSGFFFFSQIMSSECQLIVTKTPSSYLDMIMIAKILVFGKSCISFKDTVCLSKQMLERVCFEPEFQLATGFDNKLPIIGAEKVEFKHRKVRLDLYHPLFVTGTKELLLFSLSLKAGLFILSSPMLEVFKLVDSELASSFLDLSPYCCLKEVDLTMSSVNLVLLPPTITTLKLCRFVSCNQVGAIITQDYSRRITSIHAVDVSYESHETLNSLLEHLLVNLSRTGVKDYSGVSMSFSNKNAVWNALVEKKVREFSSRTNE